MSDTPIFLINIEGQTKIKAIKDTGKYYLDLDNVVNVASCLVVEYLDGFSSLQKYPRAISVGNITAFSNECETKVCDVIKDGTQSHNFTVKVKDVLDREHGITFLLRRVNVED